MTVATKLAAEKLELENQILIFETQGVNIPDSILTAYAKIIISQNIGGGGGGGGNVTITGDTVGLSKAWGNLISQSVLTVGVTAVGFASIPINAKRAYITIEKGGANDKCIRSWSDGQIPTATTGQPLYDKTYLELQAYSEIVNARYISVDGANHKVYISYYDN